MHTPVLLTPLGFPPMDENLHDNMEGVNEVASDSSHKDFPTWEQAAGRMLYCLASYVHDQMLGYIRVAKTPKEA